MISPFNKRHEGKILGAMEDLTGGADVAGGGDGLGEETSGVKKGYEWSGVAVLPSEGIALVKTLG